MATLNVPGDFATIQAAINASTAGDTVVVTGGPYSVSQISLNKAITLRTTSGAVLNASTPGSGSGIEILSDNCTIEGNWTINNFGEGIAVDPGNTVGYDNVTIRGIDSFVTGRIRITNVQFGMWICGEGWDVRNVEIDEVHRKYSGDIDYARVFGRDHYFYRMYFHGIELPSDLAPLSGTDYGHTDCFQFYNQNTDNQRILIDCTWEECMFTEFVQGMFIANEFVAPNCISGLTITDCVFFGTSFTPASNLIGQPSHGIFLGKEDAITDVLIQNCTFVRCANVWTLDGIPGSTITIEKCIYDGRGGGTVYSTQSGTPRSVINVGTGNWIYNYGWIGGAGSFSADVYGTNPQLGTTLLGSETDDPWGAGAGWRPAHVPAQTYGPQIGAPAADVTPPVITRVGSSPMTVAVGGTFTDPGYTATDNVDGNITANIVVTGTVNTNVIGTYTRHANVSDAAGNPAVEVTRTVNVTDTVIPVITLVGGDVTLTTDDTDWVDPGYTASDNYYGDITADVVVGGDTVDLGTPGTYTRTYNVTDGSGNVAVQKTRVITIEEVAVPSEPRRRAIGKPIAPTDPDTYPSDRYADYTYVLRPSPFTELGSTPQMRVYWSSEFDPERPRALFLVVGTVGFASTFHKIWATEAEWVVGSGAILAAITTRVMSQDPWMPGMRMSDNLLERTVRSEVYDLDAALGYAHGDLRTRAEFSIEPAWTFLGGVSSGGILGLIYDQYFGKRRPLAGLMPCSAAYGGDSLTVEGLNFTTLLRTNMGITEAGLNTEVCAFGQNADATLGAGNSDLFLDAVEARPDSIAHRASGTTHTTYQTFNTGALVGASTMAEAMSNFMQARCAVIAPSRNAYKFT